MEKEKKENKSETTLTKMSAVVDHWTQNLEEFHRSPGTFLAARNITAHNFVLDILEVGS